MDPPSSDVPDSSPPTGWVGDPPVVADGSPPSSVTAQVVAHASSATSTATARAARTPTRGTGTVRRRGGRFL